MRGVTIAACQINPIVGDLEGNAEKIIGAIELAKANGASVAVFPELAVSGYPPEDLLAKSTFLERNRRTVEELAEMVHGITAVVGTIQCDSALYNCAAVMDEGKIVRYIQKEILPNYLVFDEKRYFTPGSGAPVIFEKNGVNLAVTVCEDAWFADGPIAKVARSGAEVVININASPYSIAKRSLRAQMLKERSGLNGVAVVYLNQVGGQDELVFDGASMIYDRSGELVALAESHLEEILFFELPIPIDNLGLVNDNCERVKLSDSSDRDFENKILRTGDFVPLGAPDSAPDPRKLAESFPRQPWEKQPFRSLSESITDSMMLETYQALLVGTRDYVTKNGFADVVLGLSGGIDSALVATIASDALGPGRVHCVAMPSRYSSRGSVEDAKALAINLGVDLMTLPIERAHRAYLEISNSDLGEQFSGLTEENLQSRLRGVLLMALSNQRGWLVLTTGNKSELATGYSTLYGDTAGGFGVIKDLSKTMVFRMCRMRNELGSCVIPESILSKAPSAELRLNQRDDESLPPYEVLDPIVEALVEMDYDVSDLMEAGFDPETVVKVARLIDLNEYKRRQNPPGVRITQRAFGKDRRVPITNGYKPWK